MSPARALLALLLTFIAQIPLRTAFKPLQPRNVKLTSVVKGLKVTWDPPSELDGRPVDRYSIGYGKSMKSLRFITVDKNRRSEVLEDVEPGVLHFLKMSAENEEGMSKPVYRAETPGGGEWVKLDGFAVESRSINHSSQGRRSPEITSKINQRAPQSSSGPESPHRGGYLPIRPKAKPRMDLSQPQADQRNANKPKLASESVYVVSLQAQKGSRGSAPTNKALINKNPPPEPEVVEEVEDITVRVLSPQSVLITWVDPLVEKQKSIPEGSRHYMVKYREKGESARWEYKETTQRRLMIETLSADGMYEFSIRISQGGTEGKWSPSVFQRTPESAPSGPPEDFQVKPLRGKGTAVLATWVPPEEPNGKIREYILSYAPAMKPFGAKSVTYRGTATSATIDGLTPGDRYIFKIRAVNRKGQGPQSKALIVAMPKTSPTASGHQLSTSSRTSTNESTKEPETTPQTTTAPPTTKKPRPIPQTRSYHSIFSVRNTGSKSRTPKRFSPSESRNKDREQEETPTETPKEDVAEVNEAVEDTQPESSNNVPSIVGVNRQNETSPGAKESSSLLHYSPLLNTQTSPPKSSSSESLTKTSSSHRQNQPSTSRMSSSVDIMRFRRPNSRTTGVRSRIQNGTFGGLPNSPGSTSTRKDNTGSSYSEGKDSYSKVTVGEAKPSTASPQETKTDTGRDSIDSINSSSSSSSSHSTADLSIPSSLPSSSSSSSSFSSSSSSSSSKTSTFPSASLPSSSSSLFPSSDKSRPSSPTSRGSGLGSGSVYPNSRRVGVSIKSKLRPHLAQRKSTSSQFTIPIGSRTSDKGDTLSKSSRGTKDNTKIEKHEAKTVESKTNESQPSPQHPPTTHSLTTKENTEKISNDNNEGKSESSSATSHLPSRTQPILTGRGSSMANRNSKLISSSKRQDTRTSLSRPASTVGAGRPVLRGDSFHSSVSEALDHKDKTKASPTPSPSKHQTDPTVPSKPNVISSETVSMNRQDQIHNEHSQTSNDHEHDNLFEDSKTGKKIVSSTASPKTMTLDLKETPKVVQTENGHQSVSTVPRRPILGPNARFRSPVLASRLNGSRFPGRVQPSVMRNPVAESRMSSSSRSDPISRGKIPVSGDKPNYAQGKNGQPILTVTNDKFSSTSKANGVKYITGPDGTKWVIDLEKAVLKNEAGKVLQDSRGRPRKVVLGEDGKTVFDEQGTPLVNQDGVALFGHGRDGRPVVNPKDKYLTVGGKPVVGLDRPKSTTTTTTARTTTATTIMSSTTTTTKVTTTTTPEPTTTEMTTLEPTTIASFTCPPGTFSRMDENGLPVMDADGILDCYPEEAGSGMGLDPMVTITMAPDDAFAIEEDFLTETTLPPTTIPLPITTQPPVPETRPFNNTPSSEFDATGKKRFTAPYVNYITKDPGAPCSLTEALEYLQVDVLSTLIEQDSLNADQKQPPKNKPHNITVVAMEGCHSFVILDWARPLKHDMVSGYLVHSASYDDVLNNRWSSRLSSGTHLAVENLKPNSRYYFRVQAKNIFGLGPVSDTLSYVTESDDPLLIERPPGGEPIWIPFTFRYNPAHSSCKGSQFVKRTWYRKFVGVVLCNSLRYKIFMGEGLKDTFYSIADTIGNGEDHCQFVDSYRDGRTGPHNLSLYLPAAQGYYRSYRQEPVSFGPIGKRTPHPFVGWYECGVPIPGKW